MKQSELFEKIKETLSRPGAWIQGQVALDIFGVPCHPASSMACEFDLLGATLNVQHRFNTVVLWHESGLELSRWNDAEGRTFAQVLAKIDLEIRLATIRENFADAA